MSKRAIAGEKPIGRAPWLPRIAIAAALSACVLTEGCMAPKHPECAFYFRGENAKTCEGVRCKLNEARMKLISLEDEEKAAARTLGAKIAAGQECSKEVDAFNSIYKEIGRISKKLDGYMDLEIRIREGDAEEGEIRQAFDEVVGILGKFVEFEQALVQMGRNI